MNSNQKQPGFALRSTSRFAKQLSKLPREVESAVLQVLSQIEVSGVFPKSKPLTGRLKGLQSTRIAVSYRLIYEVDFETKVFYAIKVGHRRDVYR